MPSCLWTTRTFSGDGGLQGKRLLLEAGPVRLRPILMTTFAMIMGMMPIAIGIGEGAETRSPMAIATIGGLITSLLLTLIVIPVAYDVLDEMKERHFPKKGWLTNEDAFHRIQRYYR